jgi:hypothetical protein
MTESCAAISTTVGTLPLPLQTLGGNPMGVQIRNDDLTPTIGGGCLKLIG